MFCTFCLTISLGYPKPDEMNVTLSGLEVSLVNAMSRETIFKQYLDTVKQNYDYVLIDCMSSLGMLTLNACIGVIIPIAEETGKCYSYHRQWNFLSSVVLCGNLTITDYEK